MSESKQPISTTLRVCVNWTFDRENCRIAWDFADLKIENGQIVEITPVPEETLDLGTGQEHR